MFPPSRCCPDRHLPSLRTALPPRNVLRVMMRLWGSRIDISKDAVKKQVGSCLESVMPKQTECPDTGGSKPCCPEPAPHILLRLLSLTDGETQAAGRSGGTGRAEIFGQCEAALKGCIPVHPRKLREEYSMPAAFDAYQILLRHKNQPDEEV